MEKKKLLIITKAQFGYHIDSFKYCDYLKNLYEITYLCSDYRLQKFYLPQTRVIYISRNSSLIRRNFQFIKSSIEEIRKNHDLVLVKYFNGCSLLKIFGFPKLIIANVRSAIISSNAIGRYFRNLLLKVELLFFDQITFISLSLAQRLQVDLSKSHVLPLGSDIISATNKNFRQFRLLYVGTFSKRRVIDTVVGVHRFYEEHNIGLTYTIIGSGYNNEEDEILNYIKRHDLNKIIKVLGYIPHSQLATYFDTHNIGISYIPITDFFDCQPPTKTYEYILSGMAVLATKTSENAKIVNAINGKLIEDNSDSFYEGLCHLYRSRSNFNSTHIRDTASNQTWEKIILNNLYPYLDGLLSKTAK